MMKYKVGDKIKIVRATTGCYGAEGKIGIITNRPSTDGLTCYQDGFNVDCGDEHVWRIGQFWDIFKKWLDGCKHIDIYYLEDNELLEYLKEMCGEKSVNG